MHPWADVNSLFKRNAPIDCSNIPAPTYAGIFGTINGGLGTE